MTSATAKPAGGLRGRPEVAWEFRGIDWHRDAEALRAFDTGFVTDRVHTLRGRGLSFSPVEEACAGPCSKRYQVSLSQEAMAGALVAIAAVVDGLIGGFAVVAFTPWNRRAVITDFHVASRLRRRGLGRAMMAEVIRRMGGSPKRTLWVETQNVNPPAVHVYRSCGFGVCGLDRALYDEPHSGEVAVFLARRVGTGAPGQP